MKLRIVPARNGALWVRSGFRIFFRRPLAFGSLFAAFLFGVTVLMLVPYVGVLLVLAALPLVTQAFMVATRRALHNQPPMPDVFVEPLRAGRPQAVAMLQIGVIYALATVALMWAGGAVDGGKFEALEDAMLGGAGDAAKAQALLSDPRLTLGVLIRVGFAGLLSLPFWHAPALVHWGAQAGVKSLFFSTVACWRNKAAFAVYALTWVAVLLAFGVFANVVFAALGQTRLVALAALPAGLMFSTVFYASLYFTFADCFEHRPGPDATASPAALKP